MITANNDIKNLEKLRLKDNIKDLREKEPYYNKTASKLSFSGDCLFTDGFIDEIKKIINLDDSLSSGKRSIKQTKEIERKLKHAGPRRVP